MEVRMKLIDMLAKSCYYAQEHIDDKDAWRDENRESHLTCISYQIACFLSQYTVCGKEGVDSTVIISELCSRPMKTEAQWKKIINVMAEKYGGWKTN
jgi:hypothetical protein